MPSEQLFFTFRCSGDSSFSLLGQEKRKTRGFHSRSRLNRFGFKCELTYKKWRSYFKNSGPICGASDRKSPHGARSFTAHGRTVLRIRWCNRKLLITSDVRSPVVMSKPDSLRWEFTSGLISWVFLFFVSAWKEFMLRWRIAGRFRWAHVWPKLIFRSRPRQNANTYVDSRQLSAIFNPAVKWNWCVTKMCYFYYLTLSGIKIHSPIFCL